MPTADYTPSLPDLANFMKSRAKTRYGQQVGTFDESTPVTKTEAEGLIAEAADEVAVAVGPDLPDGPLRRGAKAAVLILSSMNVEIALAPEQVNEPRSPYNALEKRFERLIKSLIEAVAEGGAGGGGESVGSKAPMPAYSFPEDQGGMVGWGTRF